MTEHEIFTAAMELSKDERKVFLDRVCDGNAILRSSVEELLALHDSGSEFMAVSAAGTTMDDGVSFGSGSKIGPFHLREQLGEGGMGVVYRAHQVHPFERYVAIKIIKPGLDTKEVVFRFQAEQKTLALMDHPFVAKVLEAGQTENGRPYFVMELVDGLPITEFCDKNLLTMKQRLALFIDVCKAVQHAHSKSVIHRDIKPSNVLVQMYDGVPTPKVIDFGVAKALDPVSKSRGVVTQVAQVIGTPLYMSPEQADSEKNHSLDTRTDIYSLGVLLYELLTGTTPFERSRLLKVANDEVRRIIREEEPPKPSTKVSTLGDSATSISELRATDPKRLQRTLQGELDWIVMKALEKDRERRYETAVGFADDVQRFLDLEPVVASPPSKLYRWRRLAKRNFAAVLTGAIMITLLFAGTVGTTWGLIKYVQANADLEVSLKNEERMRQDAQKNEKLAKDKSEEAVEQAEIAKAVSDFFNNELLASVMPSEQMDKGRNVSMRSVLDSAVKRLNVDAKPGGRFANKPMVSGRLYYTMGVAYYRLGELKVARKLLENSHEIRLELFGEYHELTLEPLHALAGLYSQIGELDLSDETSKKVIEGFERIKGADHRATLIAKSNLAANYMMRANIVDGTKLYEEIVDAYLRTQGPEHPETLSFQTNLVNCYRGIGETEKAKNLAKELLTVARRVKNGGHVVSYLVQLLGMMEAKEEKYEEAKGLLSESVAIRAKLLGDNHPDTLAAKRILASIEMKLGEDGRAAKTQEEVYAESLNVLGPTSFDTINAKISYLDSLIETENWDKAIKEARRDFDLITNTHGFRHVVIVKLSKIIEALAQRLSSQEREDGLVKIYELQKKIFIGTAESSDATPGEISKSAKSLLELPEPSRDLELAEKFARLAIALEEDAGGENVEQFQNTLELILETSGQ